MALLIGVCVVQLGVATYGGYFSGGQSILILTVLALMGMENMHEINAFKMLLAACINSVAVTTFIVGGVIIWPLALLMASGAIAGGYGGASLARKIDPRQIAPAEELWRRKVMLRDIPFVIWFFLPAGLGNVAPIVAAKLPYLKAFSFPLDGYARFRGKRLFGDHKTVRGFLSGILTGILTASLQVVLYRYVPLVREVIPIDYAAINPLLFGMLASLGALTGDALKSFFKRQFGIAPGKSWVPFDQIDYVLGGIAFTALYIRLTLLQYLLLLVIWSLLHPLATFVGYTLKLKDSPM